MATITFWSFGKRRIMLPPVCAWLYQLAHMKERTKLVKYKCLLTMVSKLKFICSAKKERVAMM